MELDTREGILVVSFTLAASNKYNLQVAKLLVEQAAKEEEWNLLLKKKPMELWNDDLDEFMKAWQVRRDT